LFLWQEPGNEPAYRHDIFGGFEEELRSVYEQQQSVEGFISWKSKKFKQQWAFFIGPFLTLPLLLSLFFLKDTYIRISLAVVGLILMLSAASTWNANHYMAPGVGFLYVLIVKALENVNKIVFWRIPAGRVLTGLVMVGSLLVFQLNLQTAIADSTPKEWVQRRNAFIEKLTAIEGKHLVVVQYFGNHLYISEWVHNEPDIDDARIVWARDMGADKNQRLFDYFPGRRVWRLKIN
jgi:hypothetical protein